MYGIKKYMYLSGNSFHMKVVPRNAFQSLFIIVFLG